MTDDPYQTPTASVATDIAIDDSRLKHLLHGQKLIIYSILLYFVVVALVALVMPGADILIVIPLLLGLVGVVRALLGIEAHWAIMAVYIFFMFLPLLNLLALARLSNRVTTKLRAAGYQVGLLGARAKPGGPTNTG